MFYKGGKAVVQAALAVTLVALAASGRIDSVRALATTLVEQGASRWIVLIGHTLEKLVSPRGVHLIELGLGVDAIVSAVEGWCLWRGYAWAAWLVVAATALPLPLEVAMILRSPRVWRVATLVANVAIVGYLGRRVARRHGAGLPALRELRARAR